MGLMQLKRAGFLTKIVVLALLIYLATSLLDLRSQIRETESLRNSLAQKVSSVELENRRLSEAIADSDDPAVMEQVARDKGYVQQDETLYIDVAN
jgi:cell division protein FtsB